MSQHSHTHTMLLITTPPSPHPHIFPFKTHFPNPLSNNPTSIFHHPIYPKHFKTTPTCCYRTSFSYVNDSSVNDDGSWVSSASAVAAVIRNASNCSIDFDQIVERDPQSHGLVLPSPDFQRLCLDQLNLFRRIVDPNAILSVYVRPAGSYVMDRLELRRVTTYPTPKGSEIVVLVGNFSVPAGLRGAESALSNQQAEAIPDCRAIVFPLVKHPFVVGFLVAELPHIDLEKGSNDSTQLPSPEECYSLPSNFDFKSLEIPPRVGNSFKHFNLSADQRLNALNISSTVAMAYVMDQKSMLLQQTSWQNNIRMSNLVEQIRGPLSSIRTLTEMLSAQIKRNEIAHDVIEDIIVQGDRMRDTLQQLQDAVYLTKANIVRFNEESLKKMDGSDFTRSQTRRLGSSSDSSFPSLDKKVDFYRPESSNMAVKDLEMPMPPLALAPLQEHIIRPCNVSNVLADLVGAARPLAQTQKRSVELIEFTQCLQVCVEEPALRQALGNLIEGALLRTHVGGKVEIVSVTAPAGGVLVVIDDDGPDMHYMTQMHSLAPFGTELFSEQMVEDNMTWNFIAGLTVAREILESYGCVVRVISPRNPVAALGTGGTRVEVWLPSSTTTNNQKGAGHAA